LREERALRPDTLADACCSRQSDCCLPRTWHRLVSFAPSVAEITIQAKSSHLMEAKLAAMRREAALFYSRYPGQTWKNVISLGDMKYEHEAVKAMSASRVPTQARERLRTKSFVLSSSPELRELTQQLRVWGLLLPACARFDGDMDVDLSASVRPFEALSHALHIPQLARLPVQGCFDLDPEEQQLWQEELLDDLAVILHEAFTSDSQPRGLSASPKPRLELPKYGQFH
ncbi:unnamed protein product, partial [Polarella glacialis]